MNNNVKHTVKDKDHIVVEVQNEVKSPILEWKQTGSHLVSIRYQLIRTAKDPNSSIIRYRVEECDDREVKLKYTRTRSRDKSSKQHKFRYPMLDKILVFIDIGDIL